MLKLSKSEKAYISEGVKQNVRNDGRQKLDFRNFTLETKLIVQSNGSARVKLGNTDVLVGIKVELGEPSLDAPHLGMVDVKVECSPSASSEFGAMGGEDLNLAMSSFLKALIEKSECLDLPAMCISKGKQCWILYIDALVLDSGGNTVDALSIAMRAALLTTRIPKIEVSTLESGDIEIEITDNFEKLPLKSIPLCVSMARIGSESIVDPSLEEEAVMGSRITIAVNSQGDVCSILKGGSSSDVNPSELLQMVKVTTRIATRLFKEMDDIMKSNEGSTKVGFFA